MAHTPTSDSRYITVERMRHWIRDRSAQDNLLHADLRYSDTEIKYAMEDAAGYYNSIPPFINRIDWNRLPRNEIAYFHGIAHHLYLSRVAQLIENEVTYTAGEVKTDHDSQLIERLQKAAAFHEERFTRMVSQRKLAANASRVYGSVGGC